ncbi:MAG: HAMP domain-containing protein [Deltaproteobacteria bacterium]|nr:HAMP domain-containing protein [Deltaproteobacteria bacterium]MBW2071338.1 HAMP domain-containing protein [Deltaproteobacteria bacterium]
MMKTIRSRIIVIFILSLVLATIATGIYYWNLVSVNRRLYFIENYDDLLNNILEVRRFEKNFILYNDKKSLDESKLYLDKAHKILQQLAPNIIKITNKNVYNEFSATLAKYTEVIEKNVNMTNNVMTDKDITMMRTNGKKLVDFALQFIHVKRQRIHQALFRSLFIPIFFLAIFLAAILLTFRIVATDILKPLELIQETTKEIAHGNFVPVNYNAKRQDEIANLTSAINKMAEELDSRQEELVQSRKIAAIGTFTAGIAHELNNPLNNISLTAEALIEDFTDEIPGEAKELIFDVLYQARRAAEVVGNLLDFSRVESPTLEELAIDDVIERTIKLIKNQLMLSHVSLQVKMSSEKLCIRGTLRSLQQVFLNLMLNAIHAMPNGGTLIIEASTYQDKYVRVDVKDTGTGIKSENLQKIFDPFFTTKGVGRGTGLGLSVSYAIVQKIGGYIEVASEVGKGSTFSVYLPICKDKAEVVDEKTASRSG